MRLFLFSICARIIWWSREEGNDPFPAYTTACRLFWFTVHWFCQDLGCNHLSLHMDRLHLILINLTQLEYQECLRESRHCNNQLQTAKPPINRGNFTSWFTVSIKIGLWVISEPFSRWQIFRKWLWTPQVGDATDLLGLGLTCRYFLPEYISVCICVFGISDHLQFVFLLLVVHISDHVAL